MPPAGSDERIVILRRLDVAIERFRLAMPFVIARGARTHSIVVVATLHHGPARGRGECVPYGRYGETPESVVAAIEAQRDAIEAGADRHELQKLMPRGAARNALDCALWDLEAKRLGIAVRDLAGVHRLGPVTTAFTISLGSPEDMGVAAARAAERPLLKVKLGGAEDVAAIAAVRAAAPEAELIVDANEGWRPESLDAMLAACADAGVALVEQPLPVGEDAALARVERCIAVCADESVHDRQGLAALRDRYDAINIKLDKTGGLTEALALVEDAEALGFAMMVGCMVGTSLGMAPATLLTPRARFVDLDGPLLLAADRAEGLRYEGSVLYPPSPDLWG
jgi:L-alanine-DL-glutamate epimerase-like enolase superfamily enzyme